MYLLLSLEPVRGMSDADAFDARSTFRDSVGTIQTFESEMCSIPAANAFGF